MAISGGIKFFYKCRGDLDNDIAEAAVSSGATTRNNARSRKTYLKWESEGSDDTTTETYELRFGAEQTINRLLLVRNNFKAFSVQYWNGSTWVDFSNVVTKEGTQASITETANAKTTNYYEFDSVTTEKILVSVDTTQTVDAEKYLYQIIATAEIGTFQGYPRYEATHRKRMAEKQGFDGKTSFSVLGESYACSLGFTRYGVEADHLLVQTLWQNDDAFYIYPCGANEGQFRYTSKIGNRLRDIYLVWFNRDLDANYEQNVYALGLNYTVGLLEVV